MDESKNIVVFDASEVVDEGVISRIDRSGIIEPGHHWRCLSDVTGVASVRDSISFEFHEGLVYLLTKLVFFDGKLHSVELLNDPTVNSGTGVLTVPLLVEHFEPLSEEAAQAFRQQQMLAIQAEAAEVQKEMAESQTNPALLEPVIAEGLQAWERELARANRRDEEDDEEPVRRANLPAVASNGQFNLTAAINHRISSTDIAVFRHMAQREGKIAEIRGKWLTEKVEDLGRILKKLAPFYSEHAAVGQARAHEALGLSKEVEKGLRSLRLYTGDGVTVTQLAEGASAPAGEPLTVYQRKLFMDEEFAVWDTVDRMFDYLQSDKFFAALREHEGLRQALIPAPRGVVAMAVRRKDVNYDVKTLEQALVADQMNRENKALFLLVRDGENWYQVFSDEPSHELSSRLFPTRSEMDSIFNGIDGEKIGFEDLRFTARTTEYDRKALGYKRFLILACGLDHSRKLFGEFYPEREALSFISLGFQSKYMRFVADDDSDVMLGDTVPDVHTLISQNQDQLAAGCRVLVFGSAAIAERDAAPGAYNNGTSGRDGTYYSRMVRPVHKAIFLTVRRDKDDLVVHLPVERKNEYTSGGWGRPQRITRKHFSVKVALNKLRGGDLAYLITDTLRADELLPYIHSREQRCQHWDFLYGFKLAAQMLAVEETANAPLMAHLESEARVSFGLAPAAAAIAATSAAQGWRLKNPDADVLPAVTSPEYADLAFQLAEASYAFTHAIPAIEKDITLLGGRLVRVMRGKKGLLIAYYEQPESEKDARIKPWRWLGRRTYTAAGKQTKEGPQSVWMISGRISGEAELFSVPTEFAQQFPDGKEKLLDKLTARLEKVTAMTAILAGAFTAERYGVSAEAWVHLTAENEAERARHWHQKTVPFNRDKRVFLPLGMETATGIVVGIAARVYDVLYHYGSDAQRGALMEQGYTLPKPKKDHERKVIPYEGPELVIHVDQYVYPSQYTGPVGTGVDVSPFRDYATGPFGYKGENRLDHALNFMLSHSADDAPRRKNRDSWDHTKYLDGSRIWLPAALRKEDGTANVSQLFPGLATA